MSLCLFCFNPKEVIPYLLGNKNDVIALAQTGTGKTASYGIPVIQ